MAERAVNVGDFDFKGIALSREQHADAQNRLGNNASIVLEDYRKQHATFDRIGSTTLTGKKPPSKR